MAKNVRWIARGLGVVILGTVALLFFGNDGFNPFRATAVELALMACFLVAWAGLLVAWRREALGGGMTVGGMAIFYLVHLVATGRWPGGWALPAIALPGLLFLMCAWLDRGERRPAPA